PRRAQYPRRGVDLHDHAAGGLTGRTWFGRTGRWPGPAVVVPVSLVGDDLPREVVAVLLVPEQPPAVLERLRFLGPQDAADRRVAVGHVDAGDLVVALVVETVAERGEHVVLGRRRVTALGDEPDGLRAGAVI